MKISKILILFFLLIAGNVYANVSLSLTDVTFSTSEPVEGEQVRIFARVYNYGDNDVYGLVKFDKIGEPQVISIRPNTFDDVFVDWAPSAGDYDIEIKVSVDNKDNSIIKKIFVDKDSDNDGIGDLKDKDNDNDGITDEQELRIGTNPMLADTDNDGINDKDDLFPLDPNESADNDLDGIGDNEDIDDDNDGIYDYDEIVFYDTDPLSSDTDKDYVPDKIEIDQGTNPKEKDSDGDGIIDSEDKFPLDPNKSFASILDAAKEYLNKIEIPSVKILGLVLLALFILLMILIKRR